MFSIAIGAAYIFLFGLKSVGDCVDSKELQVTCYIILDNECFKKYSAINK